VKKRLTIVSTVVIMILTGWGGTPESTISGDEKQNINFHGTLETWASAGTITKIDNISIDHLYKQIPLLVRPTRAPKRSQKTVAANAAQKATQAAKKAVRSAKKAAATAKRNGLPAATQAAKAAQAAADAAMTAANAATAAARAITAATPRGKKVQPKEHILKDDPQKTLIKAKIDLAEVGEIRVPHPDQEWTYQKEKQHRKKVYLEIVVISKDAVKTKMHYLIKKTKKIYCDRISAAGPEELEVPLQAVKSLKIKGYEDRELQESKRRQREEREVIKKLSKKTKKVLTTKKVAVPAA